MHPLYPDAQKLIHEINSAIAKVEDVSRNAQHLFLQGDVRAAQQRCMEALAMQPGHSGMIALHAQINDALEVELALQEGKELLANQAYPDAKLKLERAAELLEKGIHNNTHEKPADAWHWPFSLAECYAHCADCDRKMWSPPPEADHLYSRAIVILDTVYITAKPGQQKDSDNRARLRASCVHSRALGQYCRGNLDAAVALSSGDAFSNYLRDVPALLRMSQAPKGAVEVVEVFLNERYVTSRGYSSGHLLSDDPPMFSDSRGGPEIGYRGQRHGTPNEDAFLLPDGWAWVPAPGANEQSAPAPWVTSAGCKGYDKDGFEYSTTWDGALDEKEGGFTPKPGFSSYLTPTSVRRQRLTRTAIKLLPRPPTMPQPESGELLCCGYMSKIGANHHNWLTRWFELRNRDCKLNAGPPVATLRYYSFGRRGVKNKEKGVIEVSSKVQLRRSKAKDAAPMELELMTAGRVYRIRASSEVAFAQWESVLRHFCAE
eukprot:SAG31_NODE_2621_length_5362_cov_5.185256_5_plen_488_part_00